MLYCEKCRMMAENGRCDNCKGKGLIREPVDNDPVLLAKVDQVSAAMLEGIMLPSTVSASSSRTTMLSASSLHTTESCMPIAMASSMSPDIIGGKLPDASFYLADPR